MRMPSGLLLPFALSVVLALFLAPPVQADEKVKLTGDEIKEILTTPGNVSFGVDHLNNTVWIRTALDDGNRHAYWQRFAGPSPRTQLPTSGEFTGPIWIADDQVCARSGYSSERCLDIYRIGNDKYENWWGETLHHTWYQAN
jgi:hypothetical protein